MKKVLISLFAFTIMAYTSNKCMIMEEAPDLISLGRIVKEFQKGKTGLSENVQNALNALPNRREEFNEKHLNLTQQVDNYQKNFGGIQDAEVTNKRLSIAKNIFLWCAATLFSANQLLPLAIPCVKHFWNLHPRLSFATDTFTVSFGTLGILLSMARFVHSNQLQKYENATADLSALDTLDEYFQHKDTSNNDGDDNNDDNNKDEVKEDY